MRAKDEGLVQVCKNAQFLTVKKLGYADHGLADSNNFCSIFSRCLMIRPTPHHVPWSTSAETLDPVPPYRN